MQPVNFIVGTKNMNGEGRTVANESKQNAAFLAGALGAVLGRVIAIGLDSR